MENVSAYTAFVKALPLYKGTHDAFPYLKCTLRRRQVRATPEELVRQYVLAILLKAGYSRALMQIERAFAKGRRADVLAFDREKKPYLLVECKRADHDLSQADLFQLIRYTKGLAPPYVALSNGFYIHCIARKDAQFQVLKTFPPPP